MQKIYLMAVALFITTVLTAQTPVLVKDIYNFQTNGSITGAANYTTVGTTVFFTAIDGINGFELWKSDGTAAGTVMVKNINPGDYGSQPNNLTNVNGTLFFSAAGAYADNLNWGMEASTRSGFRVASAIDEA